MLVTATANGKLEVNFVKYQVYQPSLTGNEKKYVNECLDTSWISSKGKFISCFEEEFSKYVGAGYAAGVSNGTVAIHLALTALGVGEGDEVIVPTFTYVASVNPIVQVGAKPIFVDSSRFDWQISPEDIERKISDKTKCIIVTHLYGHPCDMEKIMRIAERYKLFVVEDCAEAFGSRFKGQHVGTFGDIGTFSFFGNKTITTGEGGMVITNKKDVFEKLVHLKSQGVSKEKEYWHDVVGFNYRMTNIEAAIGLAQLEQADEFLQKKRQIAPWYQEFLDGFPLEFLKESEDCRSSYWMVSALAENTEKRNQLRAYLKSDGIETRPTFYPIHTMPMYTKYGAKCPVAEDIALRGMNLPSYPALTRSDVLYICEKIKAFYAK